MLNTLRPTFYYRKNKDKPIRAGGILFYKKEEGNIFFLMINNNGIYEDIGGKTDNLDKTIGDTIKREVFEESNGIIDDIKINISNKRGYYNKSSKYLIYAIEADSALRERDCADYGECERHSEISRTFVWINKNNIKEIEIHTRIKKFINIFKG